MNEAHVKAVIVDEVEKYFRTRFPGTYDDFLEKTSFTAEIIHYINNFGKVEAYVLTTIISEDFPTLSRKPLVRVIISDGKLYIEEYRTMTSQFIYLEKGAL